MNRGVVAVSASNAKVASGQSGPMPVPVGSLRLSVLANVTAVSGTTPSMTLLVQWSVDGGQTFFDADPFDSFTAITVAGKKVKDFAVKGEHFQLVWSITGTTPSFTFDSSAYGV